MLVSFCGIDGCGKTTQATMLANSLCDIYGIKARVVHGFKPAIYSSELKEVAKDVGKDFHQLFSQNFRAISFILDLINITPLYNFLKKQSI